MAEYNFRDLKRPRYKADIGVAKHELSKDELTMSVTNVCAKLKVSRGKVIRDILSGKLNATKVTYHAGRKGFKYYILESDFKAYALTKTVRDRVKIPKDEEL